jgi:hypothetical protein
LAGAGEEEGAGPRGDPQVDPRVTGVAGVEVEVEVEVEEACLLQQLSSSYFTPPRHYPLLHILDIPLVNITRGVRQQAGRQEGGLFLINAPRPSHRGGQGQRRMVTVAIGLTQQLKSCATVKQATSHRPIH